MTAIRAEPSAPEAISATRNESLLAEFRRLAEKSRRLSRFAGNVCGIGILFPLLFRLVNRLHPLVPHYPGLFNDVLSGSYVFMSLTTLTASRFRRRRLKTLMTALKHDVRAIGPIVEVCHRQTHPSVMHQAVITLHSLLPRMQPEDSRLLSDHQMEALLKFLSMDREAFTSARAQRSFFAIGFAPLTGASRSLEGNRMLRLTPVLLKALERSGDSRAIPAVKQLAAGTRRPQFQKEARECLAVLEQEAPERDKQRFLLLPSSEHATQETLLRPTTPQADPQPELLLRATHGRTAP